MHVGMHADFIPAENIYLYVNCFMVGSTLHVVTIKTKHKLVGPGGWDKRIIKALYYLEQRVRRKHEK